jgi:hypothetical protein
VLVLVALHDDDLVLEIKDAVGALFATFAAVDDAVRANTFETAGVEVRHQRVLFHKLDLFPNAAILAKVRSVQHALEVTRDAWAFDQILLILLLVEFTIQRFEIVTPNRQVLAIWSSAS